MVAPTYVAENAPRGIRGLLIGFYQLFETMGAMVAFFIVSLASRSMFWGTTYRVEGRC